MGAPYGCGAWALVVQQLLDRRTGLLYELREQPSSSFKLDSQVRVQPRRQGTARIHARPRASRSLCRCRIQSGTQCNTRGFLPPRKDFPTKRLSPL
ncbi:hypothetical protein AOLI_G00135340 [Acnodon oligacanthus]